MTREPEAGETARTGLRGAAAPVKLVLLAVLAVVLFIAILGRIYTAPPGSPLAPVLGWTHGSQRLAMTTLNADQNADPMAKLAATQASYASSPADGEALVYGALVATAAGLDGEALALEGRRRDPRLDLARAYLLSAYLSERRYDDVLGEIDRLARLRPEALDQIGTILLAVADEPAGWRAMREAAKDNPIWQAKLGRAMLDRKRPADDDKLITLLSAGEPNEELDRLKRSLVVSMFGRRDYGRAKRVWDRFWPGTVGERGLVDDPRLTGRGGPVPFGWNVSSNADVVAELSEERGLSVRYTARQDFNVLEQSLLLRPGAYRLLIESSSDTSGDPKIVLSLGCLGPGGELLSASIRAPGTTLSEQRELFIVPAGGCPAQSMRLRLQSSAGAAPRDIAVRRIQIERVGA